MLRIPPLVVIGCGAMGRALLDAWAGAARRQALTFSQLQVVEPSPLVPCVAWQEYLNLQVVSPEAVGSLYFEVSPLLFFSIKPQQFQEIIADYVPLIEKGASVVSIAAGLSTATLTAWVGGGVPGGMVRAMPNLAASVGQSATALWATPAVMPEMRGIVQGLFDAAGHTVWLDNEEHFHGVTALSGSGPAFLISVWEGLLKAAAQVGLPPEVAQPLAAQLWHGTTAWLSKHGGSAPDITVLARLREQVTSRGGTTAAGLEVLQDGNALEVLLQKTLFAAAERSKELDRGF
ncbi:MAG: pyrroline-5-carboxylate reductase family protein [Holosporales bacterium]